MHRLDISIMVSRSLQAIPCIICLTLINLSTIKAFTCDPSTRICETELVIYYRMTMIDDTYGAVYPSDGSLYQLRDSGFENGSMPVSAEDVITADGWTIPRLVIVANRTMPGPTIIATKGQRLKVKVKNQLRSETVTIHWHGITQKGTPYMDGIPFITQCPILPGNSFIYEFDLHEAGTYFYHSHTAVQEADGLYGALIVQDIYEDASEDSVVQVQEWNHDFRMDMLSLSPVLTDNVVLTGLNAPSRAENKSKTYDSTVFSVYDAQSLLINGRGWYYDPVTGNHSEAPLEIFTVKKGITHKFRVIGVGIQYPISVSVDDHNLTVVSSDGQPIEDITVDAVVVHPGERFDFTVRTDKAVSNYWIRTRTLESNKVTLVGGIMRYEEANLEEPNTTNKNCSPYDECTVLNCPFKYFPNSSYTRCVGIETLRYPLTSQVSNISVDGVRQEFLNFKLKRFPTIHPTTNDIQFREPSVPFILHRNELAKDCDEIFCSNDTVCKCTESLSISSMEPLILIFVVFGIDTEPHHPIHVHGHSFRILKVGYPEYNETTGHILSKNGDLNCDYFNQTYGCEWTNKSWATGHIPGLELTNPPIKDTVMVPSGGYVIVHIIADNPGTWFVHCHVMSHVLNGMSIILNEASEEIQEPPEGFPRCGDFPPNRKYRTEAQVNCSDEFQTAHVQTLKTITTSESTTTIISAFSITTDDVSNVNDSSENCTDNPELDCRFFNYTQVCSKDSVYLPWATKNCPAYCGICYVPPTYTPCVNILDNCEEYNADLCTNPFYRFFREKNCRKFCNLCT